MSAFRGEEVAEIAYGPVVGTAPDLLAFGAVMLMFLPASNSYFSSTARAK